MSRKKSAVKRPFNIGEYLTTSGVKKTLSHYRKNQVIFSQGEKSQSVFYLESGSVKVSVTSSAGKDAVIALLQPGDFFGEGCIAGQTLRVSTATALERSTALKIEKEEMFRVIHEEGELADRFIAHMLKRNVRIEEDLVDQLFNSSEKRLARVLLLVARYGNDATPLKVVASISQETLAEMVGTTRGRVNYFMNKFRKLGFIKYNGGIHINDSLLKVVLRD
ncbi:MAG: Crp/Fnr family transcriptional regulator [Candidatus Acidiferrum sp.]|jgi:CRP-like cAMP-binding protein